MSGFFKIQRIAKFTALLLPAVLLCIATLAGDYPKCTHTYFTNTKTVWVSTSLCYDKDNRWGKARAYNRKGELIYERELRRVAGHSSVQFTYYESGAVKTASWSSAPDAGIQWYKSYTTFSEDGKITGETSDSYEGPATHINPLQPPTQKPVVKTPPAKPAPATMECAVIYSSEFWFTNYTPHTVVITATRKYNKSETYTLSLHPKETLKAGQLILAQQFDDPSKTFDFSVVPLKAGGKKQRLIILPSEDRQPENPTKETRRYYYEVRRVI